MSGLFALVLSSFLGVDKFSPWKLIAALVTYAIASLLFVDIFILLHRLAGVGLVSEIDTHGQGNESILGDIYTVIGAAVYALYCTLLKKRIVHEERLDMPMFFGIYSFPLLTLSLLRHLGFSGISNRATLATITAIVEKGVKPRSRKS